MLPTLTTKVQLNQDSYQEFIENEWEGCDRNGNANVLIVMKSYIVYPNLSVALKIIVVTLPV